MMNNKYILSLIAFFLVMTAGFIWLFWDSFGNANQDPLDHELAQSATLETSKPKIPAPPPTGAKGPSASSAAPPAAPPPGFGSSDQSMQNTSRVPVAENIPLPSETDRAGDETFAADKNFESKTMGIKLSYPEGYEAQEKSGRITISKEEIKVNIKVYDNKKKKGIEEWFEGQFDAATNTACIFSISDIKIGTFDTQEAPKIDGTCDNGGLMCQNEDKTKIIKADVSDKTHADLKKILSSIEFLDED